MRVEDIEALSLSLSRVMRTRSHAVCAQYTRHIRARDRGDVRAPTRRRDARERAAARECVYVTRTRVYIGDFIAGTEWRLTDV